MTQAWFREQWLNAAMPYIETLFLEEGYMVPSSLRISCGFPSKRATANKNRRIGEYWPASASKDGHGEILISPFVDDSVDVLGILIHEVVHHTVGAETGHRKPFSQCAKAVGLVKPWTATKIGPELRETLIEWVGKLGQYPHARLMRNPKAKKQSTRMLLLECGKCGCKVRTTRKWIDEYEDQDWPCPCGGLMEGQHAVDKQARKPEAS
jgi:hypothetical protein